MRLWAALTIAGWAIGGLAAIADLVWIVPRLHGVQDVALALGVAGIIRLIWDHRGVEYRLGYLHGRADEARAHTRAAR